MLTVNHGWNCPKCHVKDKQIEQLEVKINTIKDEIWDRTNHIMSFTDDDEMKMWIRELRNLTITNEQGKDGFDGQRSISKRLAGL